MTEAEKILELVKNSHKHRMVDFLDGRTESMIIDALNIALLMNGKQSIDSFDVELRGDAIILTEPSCFIDKK